MLFDHPIGGTEDASDTVQPAKFLIIDDHPLFRDALHIALRLTCPRAHITETSSIEEAKAAIATYDYFDLILLDLDLPETRGFAGFVELQSINPLPIVVMAPREDACLIDEAKTYGARGFIAKTAVRVEVMRLIQLAIRGEVAFPSASVPSTLADATRDRRVEMAKRFNLLTPMQRRVLGSLRQGKLNKQIAYDLHVGESTVKAHVTAILHKLKISSRLQAVIEASRLDSVSTAGFAGDSQLCSYIPRISAVEGNTSRELRVAT